MTGSCWDEGERFAPSREYPTHHDEAVMNGAPRSCGCSGVAVHAHSYVSLFYAMTDDQFLLNRPIWTLPNFFAELAGVPLTASKVGFVTGMFFLLI